MITWENTDSIDNIKESDDIVVTSDAAFQRVTNDEKFSDEQWDGYLKQNTAWLVQEIPNISFIDIWDTFLETKKTLADKAGYVLVVWTNGKSIEAVPYSDLANL